MADLPRTGRGRRTRRALLDAAEIEFGERGYPGTSVVQITLRAGVAQGTFYTYFPSKETIFAELVRGLSRDLRQVIARAVAPQTDRLAIERAGFVAFLQFIGDHRSLYRIVRQAEFVDPDLFRWYYDQIAEGYVAGLTEAAKSGQIEIGDAEAVAWSLMGMADFVGMRWVLWEGSMPPDEVIEAVVALYSRGLSP